MGSFMARGSGCSNPYPKRKYGDVDDGPTKQYILDHKDEAGMSKFYELCFGKRPAEELYDLKKDPD